MLERLQDLKADLMHPYRVAQLDRKMLALELRHHQLLAAFVLERAGFHHHREAFIDLVVQLHRHPPQRVVTRRRSKMKRNTPPVGRPGDVDRGMTLRLPMAGLHTRSDRHPGDLKTVRDRRQERIPGRGNESLVRGTRKTSDVAPSSVETNSRLRFDCADEFEILIRAPKTWASDVAIRHQKLPTNQDVRQQDLRALQFITWQDLNG